ncbi:hypothetical protein ACIGXI_26195 [Kitasatospora aureofaciens]|uniref:hypothetical protein n=1 Tax=Kitasatospora aureofaciens TaxID=1894 RepID=UPI0037C4F375
MLGATLRTATGPNLDGNSPQVASNAFSRIGAVVGAGMLAALASPERPTDAWGEVRDMNYHGQVCGTDVIDANSGPGPMTLTLPQT